MMFENNKLGEPMSYNAVRVWKSIAIDGINKVRRLCFGGALFFRSRCFWKGCSFCEEFIFEKANIIGEVNSLL